MDITILGRSINQLALMLQQQVISRSERKLKMNPQKTRVLAILSLLLGALEGGLVKSWEWVVYDVCGDSSLGPEDHNTLEGVEVAVLCIAKSGEVVNYQAFTNSKGVYKVAETMPDSKRWDACLARPINNFSEHCTRLGLKFTYPHSSGSFHTVRPFIYEPVNVPSYCM